MCPKLLDFLNSNNFFSRSQHGFHKGKSTPTAIFDFIHAVVSSLDQKCATKSVVCLMISGRHLRV